MCYRVSEKDIDALKGHFAQKWKFCQLHTFTQTCMTYDLNIEMVLVVFFPSSYEE